MCPGADWAGRDDGNATVAASTTADTNKRCMKARRTKVTPRAVSAHPDDARSAPPRVCPGPGTLVTLAAMRLERVAHLEDRAATLDAERAKDSHVGGNHMWLPVPSVPTTVVRLRWPAGTRLPANATSWANNPAAATNADRWGSTPGPVPPLVRTPSRTSAARKGCAPAVCERIESSIITPGHFRASGVP